MASETFSVPRRMHLTQAMKNTGDWLVGASLVPIDFAPSIGDLVTEQADKTITGIEATKNAHAGPSGSICFVVRRPG